MNRAALAALLDGLPGAVGEPYLAPRGTEPIAILYKIAGKMFAILSAREPWIVVKCDPFLIDILKDQYEGVGHRTHLDPRHWISLDLEGDVPGEEIARLARGSHELVRAGLTRKQRAALGDEG